MSDPAVAVRIGFPWRAFLLTCLVAGCWINASEIFRYFIFVMPMTRASLPSVPTVAPMNPAVFAVWGLWDTLLTALVVWFSWVHFDRFGDAPKSSVAVATAAWLLFFVLFWVAMLNMGLAHPSTPAVALPLAWVEMVVASFLTALCRRRWARKDA